MSAPALPAEPATPESFRCGPVEVRLAAASEPLRDKIVETLGLYTVPWPAPALRLAVAAGFVPQPPAMRKGSFLRCGRMLVDALGPELVATCRSGAACRSSAGTTEWRIEVPASATPGSEVPEDIEDLVGLILTTGWRRLGLVPIHAGSAVRNGSCAFLCASSGGGKTTLTAALLREGWRTLGDDKLLLELDEAGEPRIASLIDRFNLHPEARRWFPEVGDLAVLPRYSAWTEKRKVAVESIWPGAMLRRARPTHLIRIERRPELEGVHLAPLARAEILPTLLRQTVIPNDPATMRRLLPLLAATARGLVGHALTIGRDAYRRPGWSTPLAEALA
ncbi:MAG TPA: hypothetical protein VFG43_07740 [Geminicoccaceae bacterium]|nr:hypothetical protein [Geminicoccaceae bacterium]